MLTRIHDQGAAGGAGPTTAEAAQRARIEALKQQVREVTGEPDLCEEEGEDATLDEIEGFWRRVLEIEQCSVVRLRDLLSKDGINPPAPGHLKDTALTGYLATLIEELAHRGVFLQYTNHLSDRELYRLLCTHVLAEEIEVMPSGKCWNTHVDMSTVGLPRNNDGSDIYLRYYADELTREQWAIDYPEDQVPPHVDPPYNRDHSLPRPNFENP
jgi:hypothetical protein